MREFPGFPSRIYSAMPGLHGGAYMQHPHGSAWQPPVDVFERDDAIVVVVELPGVEKEQISAIVDHGILKVSGYRAKKLPDQISHVHQMEIPYGKFSRALRLPEGIDVESIEAEYQNGYLVIHIPRVPGP